MLPKKKPAEPLIKRSLSENFGGSDSSSESDSGEDGAAGEETKSRRKVHE